MRYLGVLIISMVISLGLLTACTKARPNNIDNVCQLFYQYPSWYWQALQTQHRWGLPVASQMAIIYQESHFNARAEPPREHILWVIPWFRPTSAYGYSQAVKPTWARYERSIGHHRRRSNFAAASDFIGWYAARIHQQLGLSLFNTYAIYLAYHEGIDGYRAATYWHKTWLKDVARQVAARAATYQAQLQRCAHTIPKMHWWQHLF